MYFSVIVPVFQSELYLAECLDSICAQSFSEFEVILVDDGSTDESGKICDTYAEKDKRFRVLHQENKGQSAARQKAAAISSGKYIINIDSDDRVSSDFLEQAKELIEKWKTDMVVFASEHETQNGSVKVQEPVREGYYNKDKVQKEIWPKVLADRDRSHMSYPLWPKAIRREVLLDAYSALKPGIKFGEDIACLLPIWLSAESVYISKRMVYFYRYRPQSESHGFRERQYEDLIQVTEEFRKQYLSEYPFLSEQIDRYMCDICFVLLMEAVGSKDMGHISKIRSYMSDSRIHSHICQARFEKITPKMKLLFFLLKNNSVLSAYLVLMFCQRFKMVRRKYVKSR